MIMLPLHGQNTAAIYFSTLGRKNLLLIKPASYVFDKQLGSNFAEFLFFTINLTKTKIQNKNLKNKQKRILIPALSKIKTRK